MKNFGYYQQLEFERLLLENKEEWKEVQDMVEPIRFDPDWDVRILPPTGGAMTRFIVSKGGKRVSVYFDAYSRLGWMGEADGKPIPYYEAYDFNREPERFYAHETESLMEYIRECLNESEV